MFYVDRMVRAVLAFVILALYLFKLIPAGPALALLILAVVFFVTSFTGFCPLYWVLGFRGRQNKAH